MERPGGRGFKQSRATAFRSLLGNNDTSMLHTSVLYQMMDDRRKDVGVGTWRNLENNALLSLHKLLRNRLVGVGRVEPQSTHRVATAAFWRTFHHDGKISPGWWGRRVHGTPTPLSLYLQSRTKLQCMLQLRGGGGIKHLISSLPPMYSVGRAIPSRPTLPHTHTLASRFRTN